MNTLHQVDDEAKVDALAKAMERDGWQGAPLVTWGEDDLLTGVHRYAAAQRVGIEVPMIDLEDIFAEAGLDFDALHAEWDAPALCSRDWSDVVGLLGELPIASRERYGIDAH